MKSLYLLMLVSLCQSQMVQKLSAPRILVMVKNSWSPGFGVLWSRIDSRDVKNPVIGYKVKIWELRKISVTKTVIVNYRVKEVVEEMVEPYNQSGPSGVPDEIIYTAEVTHTKLPNIKVNVPLEIRVNAFTMKGDGPASSLRVLLDDNYEVLCGMLIPSGNEDTTESNVTVRKRHGSPRHHLR